MSEKEENESLEENKVTEPESENTGEDEENWEDNDEGLKNEVPGSSEKEPARDFSDIKQKANGSDKRNLDFILDIPLQITVEIGRTKMLVSELLQLGQGSIVDLNKLAGEPMEVLVNDKLMARGEVVVVNEKFGIRLTDIVSPVERVEYLK